MFFNKDACTGFAQNFYLFQANAAALGLRLRRPENVVVTEGSASLMGGGGTASAEGRQIDLHGGALTADGYRTEVTGDFVDRAAASRLTESRGDNVSAWGTNKLEITTAAECTVNGAQSINFDSKERKSGKILRAGQLDFRMEGRHGRNPDDMLEIRFTRLSFSEVSVNGKALRISARPDVFDACPTFESFKQEFNSNASFRKEFGHMVARPASDSVRWPDDKLYDRRGFCIVTVVNKIEWVDPKGADSGIKINGHTLIVPGYGTIHLGEMSIMPIQRRLHMVRAELGCPDGGSMMMAVGCPGGHEFP